MIYNGENDLSGDEVEQYGFFPIFAVAASWLKKGGVKTFKKALSMVKGKKKAAPAARPAAARPTAAQAVKASGGALGGINPLMIGGAAAGVLVLALLMKRK